MIKTSERNNRYKSRRVQTINDEPTRTQQQFKDEVDVNKIMKKYLKTHTITHLNSRSGVYADLSTAEDYFTGLNMIKKAGEAFDQLPSILRTRFNNDPGSLLEFIHDPKNYDEAVKLGIFDPKLPPPGDTPITNDDSNDDSNTKKQKK